MVDGCPDNEGIEPGSSVHLMGGYKNRKRDPVLSENGQRYGQIIAVAIVERKMHPGPGIPETVLSHLIQFLHRDKAKAQFLPKTNNLFQLFGREMDALNKIILSRPGYPMTKINEALGKETKPNL